MTSLGKLKEQSVEGHKMTLSELYLSPYGRATRADYWLRMYLPMTVITVIATVVDFSAGRLMKSFLSVFGAA